MVSGEGGRWLCHDLAPGGCRTSPVGKRGLIRGGGSTARISNGTGPQDPGGGAMHLTFPRGMAAARPVVPPIVHSETLRSGEVRVSTVSIDADRRRVNRPVYIVPDYVDVNFLQGDSQA